jgi:nickel-dependent lactate racemase
VAALRLDVPYGRGFYTLELPPERTDVITPREVPGLADERNSIREALRSPLGTPRLGDMVTPEMKVVIVFCDITRPMPNHRVLPVILEELAHLPRENITLLNALGTHRENTREELEEMLGTEIVANYRIRQSQASRDEDFLPLEGTDVFLHRDYLEADFRILTGFIEPHFFAGFSGGPKLVIPGVAAARNIMEIHSAPLIKDPQARWGITEGNPLWEAIYHIAIKSEPHFIVNVSLNKHREITGVFAGDLTLAHTKGRQWVKKVSMSPVAAPYPLVITTNAGYPLDMNLYQGVKGMSAAAQITAPGGSILCLAECSDGIPSHGNFGRLLASSSSPEELLGAIEGGQIHMVDQWQAQILARLLLNHKIYLYNSYLDDTTVRSCFLEPVADVNEFIKEKLAQLGPEDRICVLPEGPLTIPYLA